MAYNTSKGPRDLGDIKNEDDLDTQIDFGSDSIGFKTNNLTRVVIDNSSISSSVDFEVVGNAFIGGTLNVTGNADFNGTIACDTSLAIDSTTITAAEIGVLDSVTPGTAAASKAMVLDASKDISGYRNLSGSGTLQAVGNVFIGGTLNVSGNADFNGTITCDDSITIDSVTITDTELGYLDGLTLGTVAASKVVTVDASKDFSGYRNISGSGTFQSVGNAFLGGTLNVSGATTAQAITATNYSGSGTLQAVGATTLGGTLNVSGNAEIAGTLHLSGSESEALRISKEDSDSREIVFENGGTDKAAIYLNSAENLFIRQEAAAKDINLRVGSTNAVVVDGSENEVAFAWPISGTGISGSGTLQAVGATILGSSLNVSGAVTLSGVSSGSAAGPSSFLALTTAGAVVLEEPGGGGGGISFNGSTANGLVTYGNSSTADVESALTFNGTDLKVTGNVSGSGTFQYVGAAILGSSIKASGSISGSSTLSCVGAITTAGGINVQTSGIANAGNITGAGNVSGSGDFSCLNVDADDVVSAGGGFSIDSTTVITSQGGGQFTTVSGSSNLNIAGNASIEGTLGVTGSVRGKMLQVTRHHYENGSNDNFKFISFMNASDTNVGAATYTNSMVAPFDGRLVRVLAKIENNQNGNVIVSIHTGSGLTVSNEPEIERVTVSMPDSANAVGVFNTTGSQHFNAGSLIGIGVKPNTGADPGRVSLSCIWEYNMFGL